MCLQVDPLKFHTFGVKKPMEEKQTKITQLQNNKQRYYPTDPQGNVDEWGAVIKRQVETYEREKQNEGIHQKQKIQEYG